LNVLALPASVGREDGLTVQPFTGKILSKPEIQDAKFGVLTGGAGSISALSRTGTAAVKKTVHSGLHNQANLTPDVPRGSFKPLRKVDMENLSPSDSAAVKTLEAQGWDRNKVSEVLSSGDNFEIQKINKGDKLYGFDTAGSKKDIGKSAYWLDDSGFKDVQSKYLKDGSWDKEGIKGYMALPCFNRANSISTVEVQESTILVKSKIQKAAELINYKGDGGYETGLMGKIMGGGGQQSTVDPSVLKLLGK